MIPPLITGKRIYDDRGSLECVDDLNFTKEGIQRFYAVQNHKVGQIRGWHQHVHEAKYITMARGSAVVAAVKIEDTANPDPLAKVYRYVLTAEQPTVLYVPEGYANAWQSLTEDALALILSTSTTEDKGARYPSNFWDVWK